MEETDQMHYKKGYRFLHEYFQGNLETVLQHLVDKNVYDETKKKEILDEKTNHQKCKLFLDELPSKGPLVWGHLMDVIKEDIQDTYVVEHIHPGYVKRKLPPTVDPNVPSGGKDNQYPDDDDDMGVAVNVLPAKEFITDENLVYKNDSKPRGLALIINIIKCSGQGDRKGTERDEVRLTNLFAGLGYEVRAERNLDANKMENTLNEFASDEQHKNYNSCIITILSHGNQFAVFGSDGKELKIECIFNKFDNINATYLQNKPKFFIIQACRGAKEDTGNEERDSAPTSFNIETTTEIRPQVEEVHNANELPLPNAANIQNEPPNLNDINPRQLPSRSDQIIAYSTLLDFVALRHTTHGSRYICTLIDVFKDNAFKDHAADLLTEVNRRMKEGKNDSHFKQQSEFQSNLTKKFYFFPGDVTHRVNEQ